MKNSEALRNQAHALSATRELISFAQLPLGGENEEVLQKLRRGVGLAIGQIDAEILMWLDREFPQIDDLRDMDLPGSRRCRKTADE